MSWKKTHFLPADSEVCLAPLPVMAGGRDRDKHPWGMGSTMMGVNRRPAEEGWMPPLARLHHRPSEVLLRTGNCMGLLLIITLIPTS
jgi:hypothetical protein